MQMPHGLAALVALTRSDMITSVTRGVARVFAATTPSVVMDLPFIVPASTFRLVWNRRFHADPARMWLRRKLVAIAAAVEAAR
jgi:DNA-binding transcriptional LysR family regulator